MLSTPENERYQRARQELQARWDSTPDASAREPLRALNVTLRQHYPENERTPDCDACGTPWPCPRAEQAMLKLGV